MNLTGTEILARLDQTLRKEFDSTRRILSFDEYLLVLNDSSTQQLRGSAQYAADMMDHFGRDERSDSDLPGVSHFKVFDLPVEGLADRVVGHEGVQTQIYQALKAFARQGLNNKLLLLHGPNGSAKSSLIHSIMGGLETYSHTPEGALYTLNWIFPLDKVVKGGIGIQSYAPSKTAIQTFAKLPDEEISARIPCDLKDHPILVIPSAQRREFLVELLGADRATQLWDHMPHSLTRGELCHRCKQISDALLVSHQGDFRKVLQHLQVERFFLSRRYRKGLVTIEPQIHVDAQFQQLTYNKGLAGLPAALQNLNLFALGGDLIDGNRGMIEYSDLLKRPVDTFKYLLSACETGTVNVATTIAALDSILLGSTNEVQLDAFKEFPDFMSFKARIELIRVPYLLNIHQERKIYSYQIKQISSEKHVAPHVDWTVALWSVLSRLKKPNSINFPPSVSTLISNLSPLEKARLYDTGDIPAQLNPEERKLLRSHLRKIRAEYTNVPYYEGRMGASAREMRTLLFDASQNSEYACLTPLAVLRSLEEFVKRTTEYDFLKQDVKDGYHDASEFIHTVRKEYLNLIDREVRDSMGLYDSTQWEDFLKKYVQQVSLVLKKEKQKNSMTGKMEDPDMTLIQEFERIVDAPKGDDLDSFRQNVISQVGAWSLDHPKGPVVYSQVFPDYWKKLEKHYYESQKVLLKKMSDALLLYGKEGGKGTEHTQAAISDTEGHTLARQTISNMENKLGYCEHCAKEVIGFLLKQRY